MTDKIQRIAVVYCESSHRQNYCDPTRKEVAFMAIDISTVPPYVFDAYSKGTPNPQMNERMLIISKRSAERLFTFRKEVDLEGCVGNWDTRSPQEKIDVLHSSKDPTADDVTQMKIQTNHEHPYVTDIYRRDQKIPQLSKGEVLLTKRQANQLFNFRNISGFVMQ